ncbi:MAG: hypothetical protein LBP88_07550 [Treponema sp.]|jgi:hypothetical protein|nr:hypothetical protein [Treponema sp.]
MPASSIDWHQGFYSALKLLFQDYQGALQFRSEVPLNTKQLRIDALIIKEDPELVIPTGIARVFRRINILEYKSPADYLSVAALYKALAYCYLYASIERQSIGDISLSLVVSSHPRETFKHMREVLHWEVREQGPGIYAVQGEALRIQVIESGKLAAEEGLWLKELRPELEAAGIERLFMELGKYAEAAYIRAYIEIIMKANAESIEEVLMKNKTVEEILVKTGLAAKWEAVGEVRGETRGEALGAVNQMKQTLELLRSGKSAEEVVQLYEEKLKALAETGLEPARR